MSTTSITNADDGSDGALTTSGPGRLTEVLSHQQAVDSAVSGGIIDATVKWDMRNPSQLIRVFEGCGQSPTRLDDRRRGRQAASHALKFDVILVSLKNAGGSNIRGLPMHVMLGRPAFVIFDAVGSVEAIAQAHALMEAWGLRKLEVSLLLFRKRNTRNASFEKRQSITPYHYRWNAYDQHLWSALPGAVFWRNCCCSRVD
jgi:hypothetical protein